VDYLNLQDRIEQALIEQLEASAWDINVQVKGNDVFLHGVVDVFGDKLAAENITRQIQGVDKVENGLTIAMEEGVTDSEIKRAVEEAFRISGSADIEGIGVGVHGGTVYLVGTARNVEIIDQAKIIASQIIGVKNIVSQLKIAEKVKQDQATLTNNIARALANSGININEVDIGVEDGKVILEGWARTLEDKDKLEQTAKGVLGVAKVENSLHIRDLESEEEASKY